MLIYIDTDTGTWGVAERNLVVFDADSRDLEWLEEDHSDSEIINAGRIARRRPDAQGF